MDASATAEAGRTAPLHARDGPRSRGRSALPSSLRTTFIKPDRHTRIQDRLRQAPGLSDSGPKTRSGSTSVSAHVY